MKKLRKLLLAVLIILGGSGLYGCKLPSSSEQKPNSSETVSESSSNSAVTENSVKIKSIKVEEETQKIKSLRRSASSEVTSSEVSSEILSSEEYISSSEESSENSSSPGFGGEIVFPGGSETSSEEISSENSEPSSEETSSEEIKEEIFESNINWVLIYKSQTDITFTVTLDNPRHLGIDALIITCDDPNSQIKVGDTYEPIQMEADGTRMVVWEVNPYKQTYHIRTTSPDAVNSFKVLDVRITNHEKFQSEETDNRDLGNNELKIYKMDDDAIKLNVVENTFEYVKFNYVIKEGYEDLISNVVVEGMTPDEDGYYVVEENTEVNVKYDFYIFNINDYVGLALSEYISKIEMDFYAADWTDVNAIYCTEYNENTIYGLRIIVNGTNSHKHVRLLYKGVEVIYVRDDVFGGIISNADFEMKPNSDYCIDIGDILDNFLIIVGNKIYKLEYKKNKNVYGIYGLKEIMEE